MCRFNCGTLQNKMANRVIIQTTETEFPLEIFPG